MSGYEYTVAQTWGNECCATSKTLRKWLCYSFGMTEYYVYTMPSQAYIIIITTSW